MDTSPTAGQKEKCTRNKGGLKVEGRKQRGWRSHGGKESSKNQARKCFLLLNEIGAEEGSKNEKEIWIFQLIQSFCTKYLYLSSLVEAL